MATSTDFRIFSGLVREYYREGDHLDVATAKAIGDAIDREVPLGFLLRHAPKLAAAAVALPPKAVAPGRFLAMQQGAASPVGVDMGPLEEDLEEVA